MPMWIYDLPTAALGILTVTVFLVIALGGLLITRKLITQRLVFSRDINDAVNYFGSALATLYSVTLGLIAVASWQNFADIKNLISKEAATIAVFYRDLGGYPQPLQGDLRDRTRAYTQCIVDKAWPAQRQGILIDEPTIMLTDIQALLLAYEPPTAGKQVMHAEAVRKFGEMVELRRQRVDQVDEGLPVILWVVVSIGGLLTIFVAYFFWIEDIRFHLLLLSLLTIFIALMVYLIAALDRPFRGQVSVTAESYELILHKVMDTLEKHAAETGR